MEHKKNLVIADMSKHFFLLQNKNQIIGYELFRMDKLNIVTNVSLMKVARCIKTATLIVSGFAFHKESYVCGSYM